MSTPKSGIPSFDEFFRALWGYAPFPWQSRLAEHLKKRGHWPRALGVPTAAGKTAALELAIYHLAVQAANDAQPRTAARRIFFVVDRRIVVDEAFVRAQRIAEALKNAVAAKNTLGMIARGLLRLGGDTDEPIHAVLLRGGLYRDNHWVRDPAQPLICVSTVDQIGSRLLFRGYGVGDRTRPIHAALAAHDALYLLDEAHLSNPFAQTLEAVREHLRREPLHEFRVPFAVCLLTATSADAAGVFREGKDDINHPVLGPRLKTPKLALLAEVRCAKPTQKMRPDEKRELERQNQAALVAKAVELARRLSREVPGGVVTLMFNQVGTARAAHEALLKVDQNTVLFTGRSRPFDRWRLLQGERHLRERLKCGRPLPSRSSPALFVVATQCLEVGADFDFDALVTECASLDALRQRFGRLARSGRDNSAFAAIVARTDQTGKGTDHFLYGTALTETWAWLNGQSAKASHPLGKGPVVDFGHLALSQKLPSEKKLAALLAPKPDAPIFLPQHLDTLARTCPSPVAEPDVSLFLHGPQEALGDLQVVWRADLSAGAPETWTETVSELPPCSAEALPLPLFALARWLRDHDVPLLTDTEGGHGEAIKEMPAETLRCPVLRWINSEESDLLLAPGDLRRLRPGDTVVLPATAGGCDDFGWSPHSTAPVRDVAEPAHLLQRGQLVLRLHPDTTANLGLPKVRIEELLAQYTDGLLDKEELLRVVRALVTEAGANESSALAFFWKACSARLAKWADWYEPQLLHLSSENAPAPVLLRYKKRTRPEVESLSTGMFEFADDIQSSRASHQQQLAEHSALVAREVRAFAKACGLSELLAEHLALAGAWHDLGKSDPRFQEMLGNPVASNGRSLLTTELLAKSTSPINSRENVHTYPRGARHEAASLALAQNHPLLMTMAKDPDLVLHLIASHHGFARPALPPVPDEKETLPLAIHHACSGLHDEAEFTASIGPHLYSLGNGVCDRFWQLHRRYGPYKLAFIETLLRLADWAVSESTSGQDKP
jgi:CRISPR-associated endonuclease/helicase Cas3